MRITHVTQQTQELHDLLHSVLNHILTEERRTDWTAKKAETMANHRNFKWKGGKGGISACASDTTFGLTQRGGTR